MQTIGQMQTKRFYNLFQDKDFVISNLLRQKSLCETSLLNIKNAFKEHNKNLNEQIKLLDQTLPKKQTTSQINKLLKNKKIQAITLKNNTINIYTNFLRMHDIYSHNTFNLGRIHIQIDMVNNKVIEISNQSKPNFWHNMSGHPYIYPEGRPRRPIPVAVPWDSFNETINTIIYSLENVDLSYYFSEPPTLDDLHKVINRPKHIETKIDKAKWNSIINISRVKSINDNIKDIKRTIEYTKRQYDNIKQGLLKINEELERYQNYRYDEQTAKNEFNAIMSHPQITRRRLDKNNNLHLRTKHIYIKDEDEGIVDIGTFVIQISCNEYEDVIRCFNKTRTVILFHHPHVNDDGLPCLGNISDLVPKLVHDRKFGILIDIIIKFLQSYTSDEYGRPYVNLEEWAIQVNNEKSKKVKT